MLEGQGRRDGRTASRRGWLPCAKDASSATQCSGGPGKLDLDVLPEAPSERQRHQVPATPNSGDLTMSNEVSMVIPRRPF